MITLQKPHHYMKYLVHHIPWCNVYVANASPRAAATAPGGRGPAHALMHGDRAHGRGAGGDRAPRACRVHRWVNSCRVTVESRVFSAASVKHDRVSQPLNFMRTGGRASELGSKSSQSLCAVCTDRRPACRRPLLGGIQTMLLLTIACARCLHSISSYTKFCS